jgi:predicted DNA-binding transcriptional regulator YafY
MSTTTTARLLRLLSLLQTRRDWPGIALAERLEISHRTVRRDVDRLRELGYTIQATMGPEGGYRLDAGSQLPPLLFDDDQAIALAVALQAATVTGVGIEEAAVRALATVRQVMPARLRFRLDALQFTPLPTRPGYAASDPVSPETLVALSSVIRASEVLRFEYASRLPGRAANAIGTGTGTASELPPLRRAEPHHLVVSQGRWYLVAWDLDVADWRIFRAERITIHLPAGPRFAPREVPGGSVRDYISARFKGSGLVNAWPCRGKVILDLAASTVLPFAGDGIVEDLGPKRCSLEAGSWSWAALAASFGRFEAAMEVVEPPQLLDAFAELASRYQRAAAPGA